MMKVADNADDVGPDRAFAGGELHSFAEGFVVRPITLGKRAVDDDDRRRIEFVRGGEEAAFDQRHLESAEIIRRNETDFFVRPRMRVVDYGRPSIMKEESLFTPLIGRMIVRPAWVTPGRLATRRSSSAKKLVCDSLVGITQGGEGEFRRQDVVAG